MCNSGTAERVLISARGLHNAKLCNLVSTGDPAPVCSFLDAHPGQVMLHAAIFHSISQGNTHVADHIIRFREVEELTFEIEARPASVKLMSKKRGLKLDNTILTTDVRSGRVRFNLLTWFCKDPDAVRFITTRGIFSSKSLIQEALHHYVDGGAPKESVALAIEAGADVFFGHDKQRTVCVFQKIHETRNKEYGELMSRLVMDVDVPEKLKERMSTEAMNFRNEMVRDYIDSFRAERVRLEGILKTNLERCLRYADAITLHADAITLHADVATDEVGHSAAKYEDDWRWTPFNTRSIWA